MPKPMLYSSGRYSIFWAAIMATPAKIAMSRATSDAMKGIRPDLGDGGGSSPVSSSSASSSSASAGELAAPDSKLKLDQGGVSSAVSPNASEVAAAPWGDSSASDTLPGVSPAEGPPPEASISSL